MTETHPTTCTERSCAHRALTRRRALTGTALAGIGVPLLAACSGGASDSSQTATDPTTSAPTGSAPTASADNPDDTGSAAGAEGIAGTADIEVGGGSVFGDEEVVVTQPTEGEFKAFTAVCTHTGCLVGKVEDGEIVCPCHGSHFSIEDGSVLSGPAPAPLAEMAITVTGDQIVLA